MRKIIVSILVALSLNACAMVKDEVDLAYKTQGTPAVIGGAEAVKVKVTVSDGRASNQDRIGVKKNGYGMEMAAIVSKQDIPSVVAQGLESELKARGFSLGTGSVFLLADVNKFYNDFKTGMFSGQAVGEVMLNVQIMNASGRQFYGRSYIGEHTVPGIMMASGTNAKEAVEGALGNALSKMMDDQYLIQALIEAGRSSSGPTAAAGKPTS